MIMIRPRVASLALCVSLAIACGKPAESGPEAGAGEGEGERPRLANPDPSAPAPKQLVAPLEGPAVGMQAGYVEGAFLFASVRLGAMQDYLRSVPLPPELTHALDDIGAVLGVDPRTGDLLAQLGIDPQARTSLSLRPLIDEAGAIQQALDTGGAVIDELVARGSGAPDGPSPAPLSSEAELLLDRDESLGVHLRWHLPFVAIERSRALLDNLRVSSERWATTCASVQPALICEGGSDTIVVAREQPGALVVDALFFFRSSHAEPDTATRRALVERSLALVSATTIPKVGELRGDANLMIASTPALATLRAAALSVGLADLGWLGRDAIPRVRERDAALRAFHEVDRVFEGVALEAKLAPQQIHANFAWLLTPLGEREAGELFDTLQVDADVPALAALCAGSLVCARSRGLPSSARFAKLARGPFADPQIFETTYQQGGGEMMLVALLLESWPNALGMLARFPGTSMQPPGSVLAENAKQAAERVLAFGFAIRTLTLAPGQRDAQWVGFARMPAMDLATLRGLLRMAELSLGPVTIEGVPGSVDAVALPNPELPTRFYAISDPPITTGEWGWAVLADADARVQWLASLPRDDGSAPVAYLEIGDLWQLIANLEEPARELGFAQAWLSGRSLRAQWDQGPKGPQIRVLVEQR